MNHPFLPSMQETNNNTHVKEQQGVQPEQAKKQGEIVIPIVPSAPTKEQSSPDKHNPEEIPPASKTEEVKLHDLFL